MAVITVPGMFLTGDHASRPAATAVGGGTLYSCSDHSLIYQSDAATWSTWATLGTSGSGLTVEDEGTPLATDATTLDFVGAGVTATGAGATKTITIPGGGGSGDVPLGLIQADKIPASPGTFDEEWEGTADTLPTDWSWIGTPPATVKINSTYESWFVLERPGSNGSTYELRRASFAPGAIDFGLWWKWALGVGQYNNNGCWMELQILNAGETEGRGMRLNSTNSVDFRQLIASVEGSTTAMPFTDYQSGTFYGGLTRTSGDNWRCWVSLNGYTWYAIGSLTSHSFTVSHFRFRFNSGNNSGAERNVLDWVRYRTDLIFPRP